jgi:hypothetical protein
MFWFSHPRQVGSRKEVAAQIVPSQRPAPDARLTAKASRKEEAQSEAEALMMAGLLDEAGPATPPIEFSVRYQLREYLRILSHDLLQRARSGAYPQFAQARRHAVMSWWLAGACGIAGCAAAAAGWPALAYGAAALALAAFLFGCANTLVLLPLMVAVLATPVFLLKRRRMPVCAFLIDETGIARDSKAGMVKYSWADIVAVRSSAEAVLVLTKRGGIPLPLRCLSSTQAAALRMLVIRHRATLAAKKEAEAAIALARRQYR